MKICLINSLYDPDNRGGAEIVVKLLANELVRQGHQVEIVTTQSERSKQGIISDNIGDIRVHRLAAGNLFVFAKLGQYGAFLRLLWHLFDQINLVNYCRIRKVLKKSQPDLIWAHNLKGLGYISTKLYRDNSAQYWQTIHDVQYFDPSGTIIYQQPVNIFYKFVRFVYWQHNKLILRKPNLLISPSQWLFDFYQQKKLFTKSDYIVIRNPLSFALSSDFKDDDTDVLNLLYIGQLEKHKGILFLLDALMDVDFEWQLNIVGSGVLESELKRRESKQVTVLGKVKNESIGQYLAMADLLVMPTLCYENSPTVISEAHNNNCLVLASNIGGVGEMIKDGNNGWLFEPGNKFDLLEKLKAIKKTDLVSLREKMVKPNLSVKDYIQSLLLRL